MTKMSVAVLDDFQNVVRKLADWGRLPPHVSVAIFNDHVDGEELVRRLTPFNVLVLTRERTQLPRTLIERLPNLKLVVTAGMRNLGIDMATCRERGIPVCGTDSGSTPTAELAWGLIIALARRIPMEDRALREGVWQTPITGVGLRDKVLGIVGLGRLGREMARVGQAFGMKIVAWSQNLTPERAAEGGATRVDKAELFRVSDIVTVHLLMSERSRGIVGRAEIALMKPTAIIVNTSRAAIVDETALIEALHAGKIAGAGLDVYSREPLPPDAPILKAPNTVLTPHLGYAVQDSYEIYYSQALEDIEAWLAGKPVRVISG
jgi:phosphoglycerate dehydrogenase-like enzyme